MKKLYIAPVMRAYEIQRCDILTMSIQEGNAVSTQNEDGDALVREEDNLWGKGW